MIERNTSEQRFYEILVRAGFAESHIKEPDKDETIIGTADFLVGDVVFEVKEVVPPKNRLQEINDVKQQLKDGKRSWIWEAPDIRSQFMDDIKNTSKKFKAYPNCATAMVVDLTEWWWHTPDIEKLLFGTQAVHLNVQSGDLTGYKWTDRILQTAKNRSIGSYIFIIHPEKMLIHHNLMAENLKTMPLDYMMKFQKVCDFQYIFMNIPNGPPLLRDLM